MNKIKMTLQNYLQPEVNPMNQNNKRNANKF